MSPVGCEQPVDHLVFGLGRRVLVALGIEAHRAHLLFRHRAFDADSAPVLPGLEVDDGDPKACTVVLRAEPLVDLASALDLVEPRPDRQVGHEDHEVLAIPVLRLPEHEHRHHEGLARAGRELQCDAGDPVVVRGVELLERLVERPARRFGPFSEEDRGLDRVALAEVGLEAIGVGVVPVLDEGHRRRSRSRVTGFAPCLDGGADCVDLLVRFDQLRGSVSAREIERRLALLRLRDREIRSARPPARKWRLARAKLLVEAPVPRRPIVGRVDDRGAGRVARRR